MDNIPIGDMSAMIENFLLKGNQILGMHTFLYTRQCFCQSSQPLSSLGSVAAVAHLSDGSGYDIAELMRFVNESCKSHSSPDSAIATDWGSFLTCCAGGDHDGYLYLFVANLL